MVTSRKRSKDSSPGKVVLKVLDELKEGLLSIYGNSAPSIYLYGSYARGDAKDTSDIDVLLLYPSKVLPGSEINKISPILAELNLRYGVLISILPVNRLEYQNSQRPFWSNIRREGVKIG